MWPPMVRLMTALFSDEDYKRVTVKVSFGSSLGTILVYLLSPIAITFFSWKFVFWFSAFCGVVMILIWNRFCIDVNVKKEITDTKSSSKGMSAIFSPVMIFIMITIVLHGMLRDGITTWMPSYISETYNMSNAVSILTGVVLPLFTMVCFEITSVLHRKKLRNPVLCAGAVFGVGTLASIGLMCISGKSAVLSILLSALLTGTMHGVNLMLVCMIPPYFQKYGNVSAASGFINASTYIGSALSTYGIAILSESFGWGFTVKLWMIIALTGTVICCDCSKNWERRFVK